MVAANLVDEPTSKERRFTCAVQEHGLVPCGPAGAGSSGKTVVSVQQVDFLPLSRIDRDRFDRGVTSQLLDAVRTLVAGLDDVNRQPPRRPRGLSENWRDLSEGYPGQRIGGKSSTRGRLRFVWRDFPDVWKILERAGFLPRTRSLRAA